MALKKRNKVSAEFSMSSLTDIIFLLLIFFMLTSSVVSPNALNLKLPSSNSKTVAPQSLAISIRKSGDYYLNGQGMTAENVENKVSEHIGTNPAKNTTVTIVAEKGCPIEYVVKVMDMAHRLNINAILATEAL